MKNHCDKPDRDAPKLKCGYPMPCPHHTLIEEADLGAVIPTLAWLLQKPTVSISAAIGDSDAITVSAVAHVRALTDDRTSAIDKVWTGSRRLPLNSPMSALRDAFDELTREGHLELEKRHPDEALRVPGKIPAVAATFSELPCTRCGARHRLDVFPIGEPVRVRANLTPDRAVRRGRTYSNRVGTVVEWGQFNGPLWVRVEFSRDRAHPARDNFAPCELEPA